MAAKRQQPPPQAPRPLPIQRARRALRESEGDEGAEFPCPPGRFPLQQEGLRILAVQAPGVGVGQPAPAQQVPPEIVQMPAPASRAGPAGWIGHVVERPWRPRDVAGFRRGPAGSHSAVG